MSEVWFILLDGFDLFEASAAMHALALANEVLCLSERSARYTWRTFSAASRLVRSNGELALTASELPREPDQAPERLIVLGGGRAEAALRHPSPSQRHLIAWIFRQLPRIRRLASVGDDAFVVVQLAVGLLPKTTPWRSRGDWAMTSSGMELALRIIAHDEGHTVAMQVAQRLSPSPERIGAPFRFRSGLTGSAFGDERVLALNRWIESHLREPLTNGHLAKRLSMSPRTFARFYRRATGFTPARGVEHIRLESACRAAESTLMSFKAIALHNGYSSEELMRRAFLRVLKISPTEYRRLFFDTH